MKFSELRSVKTLLFLALSLLIISTTPAIISSNYASQNNKNSSAVGIQHVIIIIMENKEYSSVIGNSINAPYENQLAKDFALATNYTAITHPSLPNYIAITAGSPLTFTSDCSPTLCNTSSTSIFNLLDSKGISWKSYTESMPAPCDIVTSSGNFFAKHVPVLYYDYVTNDTSYCDSHVVPLGNVSTQSGEFYADLNSGSFPNYAFVTPNICDDAHSCSLSVGDNWLSEFIPQIQNSSIYSSSLIFVVYDEGTTNIGGGGHVVCLAVGPSSIVATGQSRTAYDHYSVLATIESIYGLGNLGRNDQNASVLSSFLNSTTTTSSSSQMSSSKSSTSVSSSKTSVTTSSLSNTFVSTSSSSSRETSSSASAYSYSTTMSSISSSLTSVANTYSVSTASIQTNSSSGNGNITVILVAGIIVAVAAGTIVAVTIFFRRRR